MKTAHGCSQTNQSEPAEPSDTAPRPVSAPLVSYDNLAASISVLTTSVRRLMGTALTSWMHVFQRAGADDAVDLAPATFEQKLALYCKDPSVDTLTPASKYNRRSGARKLSMLYVECLPVLIEPVGGPASSVYWDEISEAMKTARLTSDRRRALKRRAKLGHMPVSESQVRSIAKEVGADPESLLRHAWLWKPTRLFDLTNHQYTWGADHHLLTTMPYALTILPEQIEAAVDPFIEWRKVSSSRELLVERLDGSYHTLTRDGAWTPGDNQEVGDMLPSERIFRDFLGRMLGFFVLPKDANDVRMRGLGIKLEDLRLAHVFVGKNIVAYCEFQKSRNGRFDHYGLQNLRQDYCTLVGSQKSYGRHAQRALYDDLKQVFAVRDPQTSADKAILAGPDHVNDKMPETPADWSKWCNGQLKIFDDWINSETKGRSKKTRFRQARAAEDNLEVMFARRRPMEEIVWPTIFWLADNRPPASYPLYFRVSHEAKLFTLASLAAEPLRLENWQNAQWLKHLFKRDGKWYLNLKASEFKNRRTLTRAYKSLIEDGAQEFFEAWYNIWKEVFGYDPLDKSNRHRQSFVHSPVQGKGFGKKPCYAVIRNRLAFLSDVWGLSIGPQAFRHIWATDWLKRFSNDFVTVAGKLNDTVLTVMKAYEHLNSGDHSAKANEANCGMAAQAKERLRVQLQRNSSLPRR